MIPIKRSLYPFLSDFCALTIIKTYIVCVKGTTSRSAWRSGRARTRGSPASTTSCWPCSPPSSVSPWRVGPPSCTGWEKQLQDDINGTMYCKLKGIHFHCLVLVLFCSFAKINKKLFHVLASLADKWRTPKVSQIVLASQSSWNYFLES